MADSWHGPAAFRQACAVRITDQRHCRLWMADSWHGPAAFRQACAVQITGRHHWRLWMADSWHGPAAFRQACAVRITDRCHCRLWMADSWHGPAAFQQACAAARVPLLLNCFRMMAQVQITAFLHLEPLRDPGPSAFCRVFAPGTPRTRQACAAPPARSPLREKPPATCRLPPSPNPNQTAPSPPKTSS